MWHIFLNSAAIAAISIMYCLRIVAKCLEVLGSLGAAGMCWSLLGTVGMDCWGLLGTAGSCWELSELLGSVGYCFNIWGTVGHYFQLLVRVGNR